MASPTDTITGTSGHQDWSARVKMSGAIVGSPATSGETSVCTVAVTSNLTIATGIALFGWVAYTAGTNAATGTLKLRQTSTTGATVATSPALVIVATDLYTQDIIGIDTSPVIPGQVYVLTLTVASGSAISTVSAVGLVAVAV